MSAEASRIVPSCGGFETHFGAEPGNTLIGWYLNETTAHAALLARTRCSDLDRFFLLLAYTQAAVVVAPYPLVDDGPCTNPDCPIGCHKSHCYPLPGEDI